ncbi:hypothetical protein, partial [Specibacter cremeus]|uniref:hypothetical protein n=1 Tax=Specibacter cremeus TaxID=1629051 RepID=UPI00197B6031
KTVNQPIKHNQSASKKLGTLLSSQTTNTNEYLKHFLLRFHRCGVYSLFHRNSLCPIGSSCRSSHREFTEFLHHIFFRSIAARDEAIRKWFGLGIQRPASPFPPAGVIQPGAAQAQQTCRTIHSCPPVRKRAGGQLWWGVCR